MRDRGTESKHKVSVLPERDAGGTDGAETQRDWDVVLRTLLRNKGKSAK